MRRTLYVFDPHRPQLPSIEDEIRLWRRREHTAALALSLVLGSVLAYLIRGAWWWK